MIIKLHPQRRDELLEVHKSGDTLVINGEPLDFSPLRDGATLPAGAVDSPWFTGDVDRVNGELVINLLLPLPVNYSQAQAFPQDLVGVPDGPVLLPQPLPVPEVVEDPQELAE